MALDRISRLVRMAAADSGVSGSPAPVAARQVVVGSAAGRPVSVSAAYKAAPVATRLVARAAAANTVPAPAAKAEENDPTTYDPLLPPEGPGQGGQTPAPVIVVTAPVPSPAKPAPSPARPAPSPGVSPVGQPGTPTGPSPATGPAPFRAPAPLGPMPWQKQPGPAPLGPMPSMPVLRQPTWSPAVPVYTSPGSASISPSGTSGAGGTGGGPYPSSATGPCEMQSAPPAQHAASSASDGCDCCCIQITALVATVAATSQTAITAITAIASQR